MPESQRELPRVTRVLAPHRSYHNLWGALCPISTFGGVV